MFILCNCSDVFCNISTNTADAVVANESSGEVLVLQVGCTFDRSVEEASLTKLLKISTVLANPFSAGLQVQTFNSCIW